MKLTNYDLENLCNFQSNFQRFSFIHREAYKQYTAVSQQEFSDRVVRLKPQQQCSHVRGRNRYQAYSLILSVFQPQTSLNPLCRETPEQVVRET